MNGLRGSGPRSKRVESSFTEMMVPIKEKVLESFSFEMHDLCSSRWNAVP
jgi:hypothetical protein